MYASVAGICNIKSIANRSNEFHRLNTDANTFPTDNKCPGNTTVELNTMQFIQALHLLRRLCLPSTTQPPTGIPESQATARAEDSQLGNPCTQKQCPCAN